MFDTLQYVWVSYLESSNMVKILNLFANSGSWDIWTELPEFTIFSYCLISSSFLIMLMEFDFHNKNNNENRKVQDIYNYLLIINE